jgi:putative lipoic acid-binding regulatory protein
MNFSISNTQGEHMRIDSAGRVLIGHSSAVGGHSELLGIDTDSASGYGIFISGNASSATQTAIRFYDSGASAGVVGSITFATSSTAYNTSSDYRLKENVETMQNGLIRLNKLNPVKFTWKETGKESEGFIAHEVDEIFSDCVHGEKDGDEMQGMDYGRITPLLVKAIQEQQEQIETLKAEVKELREG